MSLNLAVKRHILNPFQLYHLCDAMSAEAFSKWIYLTYYSWRYPHLYAHRHTHGERKRTKSKTQATVTREKSHRNPLHSSLSQKDRKDNLRWYIFFICCLFKGRAPLTVKMKWNCIVVVAMFSVANVHQKYKQFCECLAQTNEWIDSEISFRTLVGLLASHCLFIYISIMFLINCRLGTRLAMFSFAFSFLSWAMYVFTKPNNGQQKFIKKEQNIHRLKRKWLSDAEISVWWWLIQMMWDIISGM